MAWLWWLNFRAEGWFGYHNRVEASVKRYKNTGHGTDGGLEDSDHVYSQILNYVKSIAKDHWGVENTPSRLQSFVPGWNFIAACIKTEWWLKPDSNCRWVENSAIFIQFWSVLAGGFNAATIANKFPTVAGPERGPNEMMHNVLAIQNSN